VRQDRKPSPCPNRLAVNGSFRPHPLFRRRSKVVNIPS
jgi:hypothetical protein